MTGRVILFVVIVALMVAAVGFLGSESEERSAFAGRHASFSAAPEGSRALFVLTEQLGYRPERMMHDLETIPEQGTIVSIVPESVGGGFLAFLFHVPVFSEDEIKEVRRWVGEGNTFVLILPERSELSEAHGLAVGQGTEVEIGEGKPWPPPLVRSSRAFPLDPVLEGVELVELERGHGELRLDTVGFEQEDDDEEQLKGYTPLLRGEGGQVVAAEVRWGRGRFVVVASAFIASNTGLSRGDNALFLARVLAPQGEGGRLWFDEFHHGFKHERSLSNYLRDSSLWIAVCQLLVVVLLLGWRMASRFGGTLGFYEEEFRGSGDYVKAMSLIYERGGHDRHAMEVLSEDLDRALVERFRLPGELRGEALLSALEARGGAEAEVAGRARVARYDALEAQATKRRRPARVLGAAERLTRLIEEIRDRR